MKSNRFDIIVIGAGHAGVEAASVAARLGARTLMMVMQYESIGRISCNPSIGGPAKGHLAREIDAIGGEMARVADLSGIQFRMLNQKKGPAVWAPRSQNDRTLYSTEMRCAMERLDNLEIKELTAEEIIVENSTLSGVLTNIGEVFYAPKVIIAAGTFLNGLIHIGSKQFSSGRAGEPAAIGLTDSLRKLGFQIDRFKTGTPARVNLDSLNYNKLIEQPGDEPPLGFSFYRDIELKNQVSCYMTYTTEETHKLIQDNLHISAMYGGAITGTGARYCPSIEDKIVRFGDKDRHHVFIEPEGIRSNEGYVNGISTSLPAHIQNKIVASIPGLEEAKIIRYGYAIEYDCIASGQIYPTMESHKIRGLYFAGQINGTSGYEEAAAQGIVAGINAIKSFDTTEPFILPRSSSYIGVLIDDLTTKKTNEPYRMFTSRAEYRLSLRQDNADERLMPIGYKLGLVSNVRWKRFQENQQVVERELEYLKKTNTLNNELVKEPTRLINILKRPEVEFTDLKEYGYTPPADVSLQNQQRISLEVKYEGYLKRQAEDIKKFEQFENYTLPEEIDYMSIETITYEAREKLSSFRPYSLGQAARISGVNYTDVTALLVYLKKNRFIQ